MEDYYLLAIDPGIKGYISIIKVSTSSTNISPLVTPVKSISIPTKKIKIGKGNKIRVDEEELTKLIISLIDRYSIVEVVIEKQQAVANQGVTSTGTTMEHYGFLKGLLNGLNIKFIVVHSKTWQSIYPKELANNKELTTKQKSQIYCSELYPSYNLKKSHRCTTVADGLTDSLLIGTWCYRNKYNQEFK